MILLVQKQYLKSVERFYYLILMFSIQATKAIAYLFPLLPVLKFAYSNKKDLLLLPYYPMNNAGTVARFQNYLPFFEKDSISYDISYIGVHDKIFPILMDGDFKKIPQYKLYIRIIWQRLVIVLKSYKYRTVYMQRGAFPFYPDQKDAFLERLMKKLNNNVIIDFYDADYVHNKEIVHASIKYSRKLLVVNDYLCNYFKKLHSNVNVYPLALDETTYKKKVNYELSNPIKLVWEGTAGNFINFSRIEEVLRELAKSYPIEIILISNMKLEISNLPYRFIQFDKNTFMKDLFECDIALHPVINPDVMNSGGMAMKVLEYAATSLPIVTSSTGLSPYFENNEDVLIANDVTEWKKNLEAIIESKPLREKLGQNVYKKLITYHSVEESYKKLKCHLSN